MVAKKEESGVIVIQKPQQGHVSIWVKGKTPFIYAAMSEKAKRELLNPRGKPNAAEKASRMKHDPPKEFYDSMYRRIGSGPTRLVVPATMFKAAMCNAALRIPGVKKTEIGQLVWVCGDVLDLYGVPELMMRVVRSADMNRTPDIRTAAIVREWACCVSIDYSVPTLAAPAIYNLLESAGLFMGVGDFRPEKGKGNYGQFSVCEKADVAALLKSGGLAAQDEAIKAETAYDSETENLLTWWREEKQKRGQGQSSVKVA